MSDSPLVSIIIPCYNQGQYLSDAVHSILQQTYHHWECIIVNDGSTDNTKVVATSFAKLDSRIIYVEKSNGGLSSARNAGLATSKGEYVQFLDADDIIENTKLEKSIKRLISQPNCNIVFSNFYTCNIGEDKKLPPYCDISNVEITFENILFGWSKFTIPIHCALFKADLIKPVGFIESFKAIEDWIMWLKISKKVTGQIYIDEQLAAYRHHVNSMTSDYLHMVKERSKAYQYVANELVEERYAKKFLIYSNNHWNQEITHLTDTIQYFSDRVRQIEKEKQSIFNSTTYKVGHFFLKPLMWLKKN